MLEKIRIVLVETSHPGNIGAAARAMKTMGLTRLTLVAPKHFPSSEAEAMAAGAEDILQAASVVTNLEEALTGCHLVLGTSARERYLEWPICLPKAAASIVLSQPDSHEVAIVFGRERTGLTNIELQRCHYHVTIPADPKFSSLNIAAAVQVIAYEVYAATQADVPDIIEPDEPLATAEEIERLYQHLEQTLVQIDFLDPDKPKYLMLRLRRLFQRAKLQQQEVNILRGICRAAQLQQEKANGQPT